MRHIPFKKIIRGSDIPEYLMSVHRTFISPGASSLFLTRHLLFDDPEIPSDYPQDNRKPWCVTFCVNKAIIVSKPQKTFRNRKELHAIQWIVWSNWIVVYYKLITGELAGRCVKFLISAPRGDKR